MSTYYWNKPKQIFYILYLLTSIWINVIGIANLYYAKLLCWIKLLFTNEVVFHSSDNRSSKLEWENYSSLFWTIEYLFRGQWFVWIERKTMNFSWNQRLFQCILTGIIRIENVYYVKLETFTFKNTWSSQISLRSNQSYWLNGSFQQTEHVFLWSFWTTDIQCVSQLWFHL